MEKLLKNRLPSWALVGLFALFAQANGLEWASYFVVAMALLVVGGQYRNGAEIGWGDVIVWFLVIATNYWGVPLFVSMLPIAPVLIAFVLALVILEVAYGLIHALSDTAQQPTTRAAQSRA